MPELAFGVPKPETSRTQKLRPEKPVFFMHIAKTAGSYINERFIEALPTNVVATHIEHSIGNTRELELALLNGKRLFSGHVMLGLWDDIVGTLAQEFQLITALRDPIDHLASHIQWLDHYNIPEHRGRYAALDEAHRRIVDRIGAIDLLDIGQLDAFLTTLAGHEIRLLDNCQSRYFIMSGQRNIECIRPLSLADRSRVASALSRFDAVACQDQLAQDLSTLGDTTGVELTFVNKRVNAARSERRINTKHPLVRQVLGKRTIVDQWLWHRVRQQRTEGVALG